MDPIGHPRALHLPRSPSRPERASLEAFQPSHDVREPTQWRSGLVFASPHSGSVYPRAFRDRSILSAAQLRRNEDMFIDRLFSPCVEAGAPLISANFPRCYVDVNRAPTELPREWAPTHAANSIKETVRAKAGLGVVPTHIGERTPIYRRLPSKADAHARLRELYDPYHAGLADMIQRAQVSFGQALLFDCHSMPGFAPMGSRRPDIILGDRFGRSCHPQTLSMVRQLFQAERFSVAVNYPYAGGFVTEHYGRPEMGVEVVQIEVNRDLYLNPVTLAPKRGYDHLAERLSVIIAQLIDARLPDALAAQ